MKYILLLVSTFFLCSFKTDINSTAVLKMMYGRYNNKWFKTFSFNQTTERYRHDSLVKTETWYENVSYPGHFRIDFGDPENGNAVIYKGDSSFVFKNGKFIQASTDKDELTFFLGGMYFTSFDDVLSEFKSLHYDLAKFHQSVWKGTDAYVIGADTDDEKVNQLWIDKTMLVPVRFIKFDDNRKEEGTFEGQVKMKGGWSETNCSFYINDKLIQVEKYHDLVAGEPIDAAIFDPSVFTKLKLNKK